VRSLRRKSVYRISVPLTGLRSAEILLIVILDDSGQCGTESLGKDRQGSGEAMRSTDKPYPFSSDFKKLFFADMNSSRVQG